MDSCFQLLSLFYLTIGRNNEAPAAYSLTSTIKRLLDHLIEADLYSAKDLESIGATLDRLSHSVKQAATRTDGNQHSPVVITLVANRVELCQTLLKKLQERLKRLAEPLLDTHEKLVSILRCIALANTKAKVRQMSCALNAVETQANVNRSSLLLKFRSSKISFSRSGRSESRGSSAHKTGLYLQVVKRFATCISVACIGQTWCWNAKELCLSPSALPTKFFLELGTT